MDQELPEFDFDEEENVESAPESPEPAHNVLSRADFEKRLRANEELRKTSRFQTHEPTDDSEKAVKGLLEAGARFSELMVLGRGLVTPPQLLEVLFKLHQAGVIGYP